jgi:uncharacterized coiled-coil protein SlyX
MTIIEIRPFRNGWKCFEAPGVEPVFLDQEQAIDYATCRACFRSGQICIVRYEAVNAMLLNEFLKEHSKNEQQEATIARLQKQIEALTKGLQKVSAQLESSKPARPTVLNDQ